MGFLLAAPLQLNASLNRVPEVEVEAFWDIVVSARALAEEDERPVAGARVDLVTAVDALTAKVAALPTHLCWPVLRRVILAALVQRRLSYGAFSPAASAAVGRLAVQLFRLHRTGAGRKGVIDFFHVSKAGGTSFCQMAKLNGCRTESFGARRNCLIRDFDDVPRWVNHSLHTSLAPTGLRTPWFANWGTKLRREMSCNLRKHFMLRRRYNIAANEFTLYGAQATPRNVHTCPGNLNVLQLRHPYTRLRSHIMWVWALYDHHFKEQAAAFFPSRGAAHWGELLPAATNNYYIRSLLGEQVYYLSAAELNGTHLAAARLALLQFDVLLLLEEPAMNELLFEMAVGWSLGFGEVHARTSSQLHEVGARGLPAADDWAALLQSNQLDMQLYRFGALLALLDSVVFDIAREAGLGAGYTALGRAAGGADGAGSGGGGGGGLKASDQAHPGDDENWEVVGGANITQRSCGFVSEYETERVVPAHIVIR
ncbi:hypothetical protein HXX76_002481 [Chlamydomonas incerta]|uniref:Uncharacterized protein n=1 Tax=Chlamydomonas incerta TaxID=51695 RepID=A0A835TNR6_CHLIN|nr:hypothetical protein HXX76_002481 [Chlamydomonas incerta]|eukprot:KAG2442395.1 hypothetical protein HXX76_002481 [Chlamydomonas incerta]